ncbi:MAG: ferritin-like domain-containing protein [Deltaproteobacteria bacterium]|nr:ferritin-like domain-containing protein [Deltaproteobacteria bacterium]
MLLDLRREASAAELLIEPPPFRDDREHQIALSTWRGRMVNEHISASVFAQLIPQLMRAGIDAARQAEVAEMVSEELRHARLCAAVLVGLGGEPVAPLPEIRAMPSHEGVSNKEALLRNVLSVSCLSETVAVALIDAERLELLDVARERDEATPKTISGVLRQILADEVRHARFGWKLLEADPVDSELADRLGEYLRTAFAHLERHELAHLSPMPAPSSEAEAAGVCDGSNARVLFFETVEQVIVPRLEQHGIPARKAWERRFD